MGHIDAFVVDAGPVFLIFQFTPSRQKTSLLTSEKSKNPHLLQNLDVPRNTSVGVKYLNVRDFRLLGHIPHFLVDDGALFPFFFSLRKKTTTSVHKKQEEIRRVLRSSPLLSSRPHSKAAIIVCGPYC